MFNEIFIHVWPVVVQNPKGKTMGAAGFPVKRDFKRAIVVFFGIPGCSFWLLWLVTNPQGIKHRFSHGVFVDWTRLLVEKEGARWRFWDVLRFGMLKARC